MRSEAAAKTVYHRAWLAVKKQGKTSLKEKNPRPNNLGSLYKGQGDRH